MERIPTSSDWAAASVVYYFGQPGKERAEGSVYVVSHDDGDDAEWEVVRRYWENPDVYPDRLTCRIETVSTHNDKQGAFQSARLNL